MYRDFSENTRTQLCRLIMLTGAGMELAQGTDPVLLFPGNAGPADASGWADRLGVNVFIDNLKAYEKRILEKSLDAKQQLLGIFESAWQTETKYEGEIKDIISQLSDLDQLITDLSDIMAGSGAYNAQTISFRLSEIAGKLHSLQKELKHDEGSFAAVTADLQDVLLYFTDQALFGTEEINVSLAEAAWADQSQFASAKVDAKMGNAYAQMQTSPGLYAYNENGKFFSPCVNADIGAGISALELSAQGRVENEYLGVYGNVSADFLEAQADAGIVLNIYNEEGQLSPGFYAKASAQANAAQLTGTAGFVIAGAQVGITAGVTVGIGAHGEIGYTDGRFTMEAGASLGVGVSFGLDIDIEGLMEGISAAAGEAWSQLSEAFAEGWEQFVEFWASLFS